MKAYLNGSKAFFLQDSGIAYQTDDHWGELLGLWRERLKPVLDSRYDLSESKLGKEDLAVLRELAALQGRSISFLPEASFLTVRDGEGKGHHFTLLHNSAHSNISELFKDEKRRLPDEDTLNLVPGFWAHTPMPFSMWSPRNCLGS